MSIYKIETVPFLSDTPTSGRVSMRLPAGVAVLTDFEVSAVWLESPEVITLNYTSSHTAKIEYGLPVNNSLTVAELRAICTQLGLSSSGLKADLLARVQEATS